MIVEFIGSTAAGKTTLINEVQLRLEKTVPATTSVDLATSLLGFKKVKNPTLQNLAMELISFPFFICSLKKYNKYLRHTIKLFWRNSGFSMQTIHNLRSLERKIGMDEIIKKFYKDKVILVDEGPILAFHMFVSKKNAYTDEEISQFTDFLPLPDLVIYIRATVNTLIKRTIERADPPREVDLNNPAQMEAYFKNAVAMFDQLTQAENICNRLLIVESFNISEPGFDKVVDSIYQTILAKATVLSNNKFN